MQRSIKLSLFTVDNRSIAVPVHWKRGKSGQRRAPYHLTDGVWLFKEVEYSKCHRKLLSWL